METFIIVLQVLACLLMITLILLQPSKGGSFFTASNQGVFGSSGGTNFLFKATMWCAAFLAISCLVLSRMKIQEAGESVANDVSAPAAPVGTAPTAPIGAAPAAPVSNAPTAPVAPAPAAPSK
jgi:protein translocase SecG subunit